MDQLIGIFVSFLFLTLCELSSFDCTGFWPGQTPSDRTEVPEEVTSPPKQPVPGGRGENTPGPITESERRYK